MSNALLARAAFATVLLVWPGAVTAQRGSLSANDSIPPTALSATDSAEMAARLIVRSADGVHQVRLRGLLQNDSRLVDGASGPPSATTFVMRRVRPIFEATTFRVLDLRFVPDFGNARVEIFDAHADLRLRPWFNLRSGKFKPPIGLERLQGAADLLFVERGMPTNLVPQRDLGVQVGGDVRLGMLSWALGVFNGAADLATADADNGSQKDVAARLFSHPFRNRAGALAGLGAGIAGSRGAQLGSTVEPALPTYRSPAQQSVFTYRSDGTAAGTSVASGARTRLAPQAYWYVGPFGVLAEYTRSTQEVMRGAASASLTHAAWQLAGNVVLFGGNASYRSVSPTKPFGVGGKGAFEVGARFGVLNVDTSAFPVFANPDVSVRRAQAVGVVATWHLAAGVKVLADFEHTTFAGGAPGANRKPERALLVRMQHAF